jgi:hypothetical protein
MILRDRVAAAIYADRLDGEPLAAEALQVLSYTASLAIESLPFRERASTATLGALAGEPAPEPQPTLPAPAPPAADEEPTAVETPAAPVEAAAEPAPPAMETATAGDVEEPAEVVADAEPAATAEDRSWAVPIDGIEMPAEALPSIGGWESPAGGAQTFAEAEGAELTEVEVEAEPEPPSWTSVEQTAPYPVEALTAAEEPPAATTAWREPLPAEEESGIPTQQVDLRGIQGTPAPQASPDATVLLQRPNLREVPPPAPEPVEERPAPPPTPIRPVAPPPAAPADDTSPSLAGTPEVRPPSDLQGPGWAFASNRVPVTPSDEALHDEARRLARLLVSEIKLYNEEQVEEGRRKRDVYERLREDIDRSRQMYEERVEPRILKSTDYFYQELVRILAAGDARALGI